MLNYEEIAGMIDHSLLNPSMTDKEMIEGCELAVNYAVVSVCIKPYFVKKAYGLLKNSKVKTGTVVGFPHGNSSISTKVFETSQAIDDGANEIDMVINIGKLLSMDFNYVQDEIAQIAVITKQNKAILKVIFENDFLPGDDFKIKLCEICSNLQVDFVKTSTGYGLKLDSNGNYRTNGATDHDLILMRKHTSPQLQVKAAGGIRTLSDLLRVKALGVTRVGASSTKSILDELKNTLL